MRRTAETPAVAAPIGRHRKRRLTPVAIAGGLGLLGLVATGAALTPRLLGTGSAMPPATSASTTSPAVLAPSAGSPSTGSPSTVATVGVSTAPSGLASPGARTTTPPPPVAVASFEVTVIRLVNEVRQAQGCAALREDRHLDAAARGHSMDMARYGYYSHLGRDGSDPGVRMRRAGYDVSSGWAENIARGFRTPSAVMDGWMGSQEHRKTILNCKLGAIGVGVALAANGDMYWTQNFGGR